MTVHKQISRSHPHKFSLRCLACGQNFIQFATHMVCDLGTAKRKLAGEQLPFSEFFVPGRVICPHCGAEDRYDLTVWQMLKVTLTRMRLRLLPFTSCDWLQLAYLANSDGHLMHPFEMRNWYAEQVRRFPSKLEWRLRFANSLRSMGRAEEAEAQYRAALELSPRQPEVLVNLAALLAKRGDVQEAMVYVRRLARAKPKNSRQRDFVLVAQEITSGTLSLEDLEVRTPIYGLQR